MRYKLSILVAAASMALLAGCEQGPAEGSGAKVIDDDSDVASNGEVAEKSEDAALGTRDNPLAIGTKIEMGDWKLAVKKVALDATDQIKKENQFNDPPAKGRQFVMFQVEATYSGSESGDAMTDFSWAIVGGKGNTYGTGSKDYCGVIPNPLDETGETFPDGTVSGNACVSVPASQLDGGTIRIEEFLSLEDTRAFYALK